MNEKLTIGQIRANEPESLWHFLQQLPTSFEAQLLLGLVLAGCLGMIMSWLFKWSSGDAAGLIDYLFRSSFKRSVASFLSFVVVIVGAITSGMFMTESGEFVGWFNALGFGFTTGAGTDSMVNKARRPVWTEDKRAEVAPK